MSIISSIANSTATKAIDIMLLFSEQKTTWSALEIADALAMPRSTIYRYLNSLRVYGLLVENESGGFRMGPRIFELARVARASTSILRIAEPHLIGLRDRFDEAVTLYERVGMDMVFLDRYASRQRITVTFERSRLLPWPGHASAKLLLALAPESERNACLAVMKPVRYAAKTLPDKPALLTELERIRRDRHAISDEEIGNGMWAVAAPVFSADEARYCVSVAAPKFRIAGKSQLAKQILTATKATAETLTTELKASLTTAPQR